MKVYGKRLKVDKVLVKKTQMDSVGVFEGEVIVTHVGEEATDWGIKEGDHLLVGATSDFLNGRHSYVSELQILEIL